MSLSMEQLDLKFKHILDYLDDPVAGHHSGDKQICYLTYPLEQILEVKRKLEFWRSLASHRSYHCEELSLGNVIQEFFKKNPRRANWLAFSQIELHDELLDLYQGLSSIVVENNVLENAILERQEILRKQQKPLLILSDLEGIHPFTRFGPVEQKIYNQIEIPLIILYPGDLKGSSLEFLGFYPPDGNYRSKHF